MPVTFGKTAEHVVTPCQSDTFSGRMLKTFLLVGIAVSLAAITARPRPAIDQDAKSFNQPAKQRAPAAVASGQTNVTANNEHRMEGKLRGWHEFVSWPEGITAWSVILTLCAITWQAFETRRSVNSANKSIRLQETPFKQRIEIPSQWEVEHFPVIYPITEIGFALRLHLRNPTSWPIKILQIKALVDGKEWLFSPSDRPEARRKISSEDSNGHSQRP